MFVCSLGSGSSGNATLVRCASGQSVLLDCGVQYPRLVRNLARLNFQPGMLDAVILSHEHADHTRSAQLLREQHGTRVFAVQDFLRTAPWLADAVTDAFSPDMPLTIGQMTITPCGVTHDAADTFGFIVQADGCSAAVFTDLGHCSPAVDSAVARADLVIIEANYDQEMLANGSYPWFLKARISGRGGHLSNADCAALLVRAFRDDRPRDVWLAHLSANNNSPEQAAATVTNALAEAGITRTTVTALPRYALGPAWKCVRHRQLTLFP